jgi:site-specific recombinase XerD
MLEKSFGLFFFLKQPKNQKGSVRYVYLRITVDGISKELSTKRLWSPDKWNQAAGKASGTREDAKSLNVYLDTICTKVYQAKIALLEGNKSVTAEALKNYLTGRGDDRKMLLEVFTDHNRQMEALIGKDFVYATLQRYRTTYDHVRAFINWKYNVDDLDINELDHEFVANFAFWLKSIKKCGHNSTMKYISNVKKILLQCIKNGWLNRDPFVNFKTTRKEVKIVALTDDELARMIAKDFGIERLNHVRDIFVFCCYTGLAYVDVSHLRRNQIIRGIDQNLWIDSKRQKTHAAIRLPLLPKAKEIMDSYEDHKMCKEVGFVLPVMSNQKMNAYLKEIADICGIRIKLTFHIARHTFATTVTLSKGVPLETVSKMLGHKSLRQTQHYAKILDLKISQDMLALKERLANVPGWV